MPNVANFVEEIGEMDYMVHTAAFPFDPEQLEPVRIVITHEFVDKLLVAAGQAQVCIQEPGTTETTMNILYR
jgi:hypothetical protein